MAPHVSKQKVKAVAEDLCFLLTPLPSAVWLEHLIGRCSSQVGESHVLVTSVTEEGEFWNIKKKRPIKITWKGEPPGEGNKDRPGEC